MWKFQDFCITQFIREINFEHSRSAKTAIFALLRAVNFVQLVNFSFQKVQKFIKIQIQSFGMCETAGRFYMKSIFGILEVQKLPFLPF